MVSRGANLKMEVCYPQESLLVPAPQNTVSDEGGRLVGERRKEDGEYLGEREMGEKRMIGWF